MPHRPLLAASLGLALAGTATGLWRLLGWLGLPTDPVVSAHGQLQVFGFVALFTMGVALAMLPRVLGRPLRPAGLVPVCLGLMLAGILLNLRGPTVPGAAFQTLSALAFLGLTMGNRRQSSGHPYDRIHALFMATGALWLLLAPGLMLIHPTRALETLVWGFAGLSIAGVGMRVHSAMLGLEGGPRESLLVPSACLWNLALALRWLGPPGLWPWLLAAGAGLFLLALRPFGRSVSPPEGGPWLALFVRTSYLWLIVAVAMACWSEGGATRHAAGTGFVLTMMIGMGLHLLPDFENRRLLWPAAPWGLYLLLTGGNALRVAAQARDEVTVMALGGGLQALAILGFVAAIAATGLWGRSTLPRWNPGQRVLDEPQCAAAGQRVP